MRNLLIETAVATSIDPLQLAQKVAAIRSYKSPKLYRQMQANPRLLELLWSIQGMSMETGGLKLLSADLVRDYYDRIGTVSMRQFGKRNWGVDERMQVWSEMAQWARPSIVNPDTGMVFFNNQASMDHLSSWALFPRELLEMATSHMDFEYFRNACRDVALEILPEYLAALCLDFDQGFESNSNLPDCDGPWYFENAIEAILKFMDCRADKIKQSRVVMTVVTKQVFRILGIAFRTNMMILLRGGSRFGKSESLEAYSLMWPGRARLITVPDSNDMLGFLIAVAEALGIHTAHVSGYQNLRQQIFEVVKQSGLFLIFDEGHFLIPRSPKKDSSPPRLDWVRKQLFDRNLPVVIAVTPDWFDGTHGDVTKFERVTHYPMQQHKGRWVEFDLPDKLPESDLLNLVEFYLPEIADTADKLDIAFCALTAESFLKTFENIAKLARDEAKQSETTVTMPLVRKIINEFYPSKGRIETQIAETAPQSSVVKAPKAERRSDPKANSNEGGKPSNDLNDRENDSNCASPRSEPQPEFVEARLAEPEP